METSADRPWATRLQWIMVLQFIYGGLFVLPALLLIGLGIYGLIMDKDWFGLPDGVSAELEMARWMVFACIPAWGVVNILSGLWIRQRRRYNGSVIIALINSVLLPIGLVFGIPAAIVLLNKRCKELYDATSSEPTVGADL